MYQLIQISFQNFFSILCTNPNTYLASKFFSVFYVPTVPPPLLTLVSPRPARIRTTSQTRRTKPHLHHHTPANTFLRPPPPCRTPNRTTAPPHHRTVPRPPSRTTVQPYHRTFPRPYRHTTANTTCHTPRRTTIPHHTTIPHNHAVPLHRTIAPHSQAHDLLTTQIYDPDTRRPYRHSIVAGSTPSRRRTDAVSTRSPT